MIKKTVSFGGLGDSYIVLLKLIEKVRENYSVFFDHLHVESNGKVPELIQEYMTMLPMDCSPKFDSMGNPKSGIVFNVAYDPKYQKSYRKKKYKPRAGRNTTWHGKYSFPKNDDGLENPFIHDHNKFTKYHDVAIQCSAGAKADRDWNFSPIKLKDILTKKGLSVILLGSDDRFYDENDPKNYVNKLDLNCSVGYMLNSKLFIGLSGFLSFVALSYKLPTIHHQVSEEHNKHYIHPEWNQYMENIEYGSLNEVVQCLKKKQMI